MAEKKWVVIHMIVAATGWEPFDTEEEALSRKEDLTKHHKHGEVVYVDVDEEKGLLESVTVTVKKEILF